MAFIDDHLELGGLLLEALAVQADIRNRRAADPENASLAAQDAEMKATLVRLTDAYMESMKRFRSGAETILDRPDKSDAA